MSGQHRWEGPRLKGLFPGGAGWGPCLNQPLGGNLDPALLKELQGQQEPGTPEPLKGISG